jgi:dTDP-4-dehydrorhamnose reductase
MAGDGAEGGDVSEQSRNYARAISDIYDHRREVEELVSDAEEAMQARRPKDAVRHLNNAKSLLEGMMVTAKWAETLVSKENDK